MAVPTKTTSATAEVPLKKTFTNWSAFEKAKVVPTTIICDVIFQHPADESCKTKLPLTSKIIIDHFKGGHGGGYQIRVKQTDGKPWIGWKELSDAGIEIIGFKCVVCDQEVQVSSRDIMNHLRPHRGKWRNAYQNYRDTFFMQIQDTPVAPSEDDDESYYNAENS